MPTILLIAVIMICFLVVYKFLPLTAFTVFILVGLALTGAVAPSDTFFDFALWLFVAVFALDMVAHVVRKAGGFRNKDHIRITR